MNNIIKINATQLETILRGITKSTIVNLTYTTDESKSRTIKGEKVLQKQVNITHVYLNHNYTNKVNNLNGTTDFVAEELEKYGKFRVSSTLVAGIKSGKVMLDGKVLNEESVKSVQYFHNGKEISKNDAINQNFFTPSYFNQTKNTKGRGSVSIENDFEIINPTLTKIDQIIIDKQVYQIIK